MSHHEDPGPAHGLPGMSKELRQTYDQIVRLGATSPAAARPAAWLAKQARVGRHRIEEELHQLEGKGVVAHCKLAGQDAWYVRRAS